MKISNIESKDIKRLGSKTDDGVRQLRKPLLEKAYDAYKVAVCYGEIKETEEEHAQMLAWAQRLRDKDIMALEEVPEKVKYYL